MDLTIYTNELAAIHPVLKRLNEAKEIRIVPQASGKHAYLWERPATPGAIGPAIAQFIRQPARSPARRVRKTGG